MLAGAAALAVTTLGGAFTLIEPAHASALVPTRPVPDLDTLAPHVMHTLPEHAVLPLMHTVVAGDTLAGLAVTYCKGVANDWTGFYHDNRKIIGDNPNLIIPGQRLNLSHCADPPKLLHLGSTYQAPHHHTQLHAAVSHAGGKVWGVTYGYPNQCGDGDGDGWDIKCSTIPAHLSTAPLSHHARHSAARRAYASSYRGSYSYSGLEALWVAAGGPAWAASAAANVAMCESGGNPNAYNSSGASGLFQILGQVVPGNIFNPYTNALNAVSKFKASGETWAQWVCRP